MFVVVSKYVGICFGRLLTLVDTYVDNKLHLLVKRFHQFWVFGGRSWGNLGEFRGQQNIISRRSSDDLLGICLVDPKSIWEHFGIWSDHLGVISMVKMPPINKLISWLSPVFFIRITSLGF